MKIDNNPRKVIDPNIKLGLLSKTVSKKGTGPR